MQINPQVNTNIIRSVTLQYCPRGMCEFHLEISQTGDNSNRGPSDIPPPIKLAKKIKQIQIQKSKAEADKSQGSQTVSEAWPGQISLEPSKPLRQTNIKFFSFLQIQLPVSFFTSTEPKEPWIPSSMLMNGKRHGFSFLLEWAGKKKREAGVGRGGNSHKSRL